MEHDELAGCLRAWRDRLDPTEAGLPGGGLRRAPGLRREEVAQLAGLSVDYLARLEQGRARNPSASVLAPLARALRLTDEERAHLFRVAGHAERDGARIRRHLTPGVQRILDRLADVPVTVMDVTGQVIASNPLAVALLGVEATGSGRDDNIIWRHFTGDLASRIEQSPEQAEQFECHAVGELRDALGRYPDDEELHELVADLRRASPRFEELWQQGAVGGLVSNRKFVVHPQVGRILVDCDILTVAGSDLRLVVYTVAPTSDAARALALVSTIGLQTFAG
jgi:transcriptional regulator with XRE-family HTH domain